MKLLEGKTAIVTGASSGIGRATALLFATHGAHVIVTARRAAELQSLVEEIGASGGVALAVPGDVRDDSTHARTVDLAMEKFGRLDIAINNAGVIGETAPAAEISVEGWRETLETNLTSSFLAARRQLPALEASGKGSLVFVSTFVGHVLGFPGMTAYGASKAGMIGMMRVMAVEYAARGVRVNALLPGGVDTPAGRDSAGSPEGLDFVRSLHAMKRIADPAEIAGAALYLASDLSSFVTGSTLLADGGVTVSKT